MSIWIPAMTIHVFIDDRLPTGLPYDGQRFVWTFLFHLPRASELDASPQKFHVFINDSRRPRSRQGDGQRLLFGFVDRRKRPKSCIGRETKTTKLPISAL